MAQTAESAERELKVYFSAATALLFAMSVYAGLDFNARVVGGAGWPIVVSGGSWWLAALWPIAFPRAQPWVSAIFNSVAASFAVLSGLWLLGHNQFVQAFLPLFGPH